MTTPPGWARYPIRVMAIAIGLAGLIAVVGHALDFQEFVQPIGSVGMAFTTAVCFLLVSLSLLLIAREE